MDSESKKNKRDETECYVFYGNSEEEAKMLAMLYIQNKDNKENNTIERPTISFASYFYGVILPIIIYSIMIILTIYLKKNISVWIIIISYLIVFLLTVKRFVILCILLYQRFAPDKIRNSCCFEPTCSNYMLQAIEKYGFWRGFFKGLYRLCRCHYPNGGIDNP